jgi:hypothetical protein
VRGSIPRTELWNATLMRRGLDGFQPSDGLDWFQYSQPERLAAWVLSSNLDILYIRMHL